MQQDQQPGSFALTIRQALKTAVTGVQYRAIGRPARTHHCPRTTSAPHLPTAAPHTHKTHTSRACRPWRSLGARAGVAALLGATTLAAPVASAAPTTGPTYALAGTYVAPVDCSVSCEIPPLVAYSGAMSCPSCAAASTSASFTLTLIPQEPTRGATKRLSGPLQISWSDATTSTATVTARMIDHKAYRLDGTVSSGTFAGATLAGSVSIPVDPVRDSSFQGQLTFLPQDPV